MRIADLIFPPKCVSCRKVLNADKRNAKNVGIALCPDCRAEWEKAKLEKCYFCGKAMIDCRCRPSHLYGNENIADCIKLCKYKTGKKVVQNKMIYALKTRALWNNETFLASQLARVLENRVPHAEEAVVTFVPRRTKSIRFYGYDQAAVLAEGIAENLGADFVRVIKRRGGLEQKRLGAAERDKNTKLSLAPRKHIKTDIAGKTVILVDDVITSGASMAVCADILASLGADKVYCAAVAETERRL